MASDRLHVDVVIFGGGAAGLWLLDELVHADYRAVLLEANALGSGQTIASQGIIHGGLKYTLTGLLNPSADAIKDMPGLWRACLDGERKPDLTATRMRSDFCYLWSTQSLLSKAGMFAASKALRVKPKSISKADWPDVLEGVGGSISRLDEQVIVPGSFIKALADQHQSRLLKINSECVRFECHGEDHGPNVGAITLTGEEGQHVTLAADTVVFAAGEGNESLRSAIGLSTKAMQRRPLHVTVARGELPTLNGHCTDRNRTRVTITTDIDTQGRVVWQIGGQVSEDGVDMERETLIEHVKNELRDTVPTFASDVDSEKVEWSTYRVNRAEGATRGRARPEEAVILQEGNVITGWPTKLVLAPVMASRIIKMLPGRSGTTSETNRRTDAELADALNNWPRPQVALPPWEHLDQWIKSH